MVRTYLIKRGDATDGSAASGSGERFRDAYEAERIWLTKTAPFGAVLHVCSLNSVMREMRLVVMPPLPAMMVRPVVTPTVVTIPTIVGMIVMMMVMFDDDRPMVMPAMMIASFGIGCGQCDNAQRDKRRCQNFHV